MRTGLLCISEPLQSLACAVAKNTGHDRVVSETSVLDALADARDHVVALLATEVDRFTGRPEKDQTGDSALGEVNAVRYLRLDIYGGVRAAGRVCMVFVEGGRGDEDAVRRYRG